MHHDGGDHDESERRGLNEVLDGDRGVLEMGKFPLYLPDDRDAVAIEPKLIDRDGRRRDTQKRAGNARVQPIRAYGHGEDSQPQ